MKLKNEVMLITYADCMGNNLADLDLVLSTRFAGAVGGIHLLPFFPSSGDRGFAPITYREVDSAFGDWADIEALGQKYCLMADYMINHISAQSEYYRDFLANKDASRYKNLFIRWKDFWPGGAPTEAQFAAIYKRKPRAPSVTARFADGSDEQVWCTFDEEQIDIDCFSDAGKRFIRENLQALCAHGISAIRLDAFAYATKKAGTSCFFVEPEVWQLLDFVSSQLAAHGAEMLAEIHEHYTMQLKMAEHGCRTYDFALPILLLNALYYGQSGYLKHWFEICPKNHFTVLDTHDGIGVGDAKDLMPDAELQRTKAGIFRFGKNVKEEYNTPDYNNLDIYQVNCTYYSALGEDDAAYLTARAVQMFAPGIPQVYYVGMLAGRNDITLLEETKIGRNINRHYYTVDEVADEIQRPVVATLLALMRFRNTCPAFDGDFELLPCGGDELLIRRTGGGWVAELAVNFREKTWNIAAGPIGAEKPIVFD